jgi:hypothetical protein
LFLLFREKIGPEVLEAATNKKVNHASMALPEVPAHTGTAFAVALTPEGDPVSEYASLDNFWKRYNKALLDKLAIERERAQLQEENDKLKAMLQEYLNGAAGCVAWCLFVSFAKFMSVWIGISVNDEILQADNSLLIINGRTNALSCVKPNDICGALCLIKLTLSNWKLQASSSWRQPCNAPSPYGGRSARRCAHDAAGGKIAIQLLY